MIGVGAAGPTGAWATSAEPSPALRASLSRPPRQPSAARRGSPSARRGRCSVGRRPGTGRVRRRCSATFGSGRAILEAALRPGATRRLVEAGVVDERESFDATTARRRIVGGRRGSRAGARDRIEIAGRRDPHDRGRGVSRRGSARSSCRRTSCSFAATSRRWPRGHAVAVVGTRRPTEAGRATRRRGSAASLAQAGAVVVSGLAVGIDGASHAAAMAEGGADGRGPRLRSRPALPAGPRDASPSASSPTAARSSRSSCPDEAAERRHASRGGTA